MLSIFSSTSEPSDSDPFEAKVSVFRIWLIKDPLVNLLGGRSERVFEIVD